MQDVLVPPRPQLNIRLDPRSAAILAALMKGLNLNTTGVIRLALLRLAEREGVPVPDDAE